MSLILNGAKTAYIAGSQLQCIEIYTGEAYTLPFQFTDAVSNPVNISSWTLAVSAKWYSCDISYTNQATSTEIDITNLLLDSPQPQTPATLTTGKISGGTTGLGYIYIPTSMSGGIGSPPTPISVLQDNPCILAIITLTVTRTDPNSGSNDINREPIGIIIRYQ